MRRTFIAVDVSPTPALRQLQERLSKLGDRFRPVALDNLHVTLKFLGDTSEEQLAPVSSRLQSLVARYPVMHLSLTGLGAFPSARRPSVVWVGLNQMESLTRLAADLESELSELGFEPESRPFQPHLTLLRIKTRPPDELFAMLAEEARADYGIVEIDAVHFYESELARSGAKYTRLATATLRKM